MDFEQALETQRHRLLRMVAGLVVVVGFLSVGPVSRGFSVWACGFVGSILARAEMAARYLVIAQAGSLLTRSGADLDRGLLSQHLARAVTSDDADVSLPDCRKRLNALRAVLTNLPRQAARLIRRIQKQMRRMADMVQRLPRPDQSRSTALHNWGLAAVRIERPPDKTRPASRSILPPPEIRAGGIGG